MLNTETKNVALVLQTRLSENLLVLDGIASYELSNADWNFFLDDQARSVANPEWLFGRHWDGVICRHRFPALIEECLRRGVPCVDMEDWPTVYPGVPKVRPDNTAVGHVGGEHLLDRAFQHFAYCGFSSEHWSVERRRGFVEAIEAVGHQVSILETEYSHELAPDWDMEEQARIQEWVAGLEKPVAIMACNDLRAAQVIEAVHHGGFAIPLEVSVLGANNDVCRVKLSHPSLSSVPINAVDWGFKAAEALDLMMRGERAPEQVFVDPLPVVTRRSTEALAVDDPAVSRALKIIHEEATEALKVDDLARRVNVSRSVLERRFRKFLRRTPQEEIRTMKIMRAKQMLLETDKTLADIAEAIGFEHPEYLSVMFKRLTGETPRDFRQKRRVGGI